MKLKVRQSFSYVPAGSSEERKLLAGNTYESGSLGVSTEQMLVWIGKYWVEVVT